MEVFRYQWMIPILFVIYMLRISHAGCHTEFSKDEYEVVRCPTLNDLKSIRNICKGCKYNVYLTHRNLLTLPKRFAEIPSIGAITATGLSIQNVEDGAFSGLQNIEKIFLQKNNITNVTKNVFSNLPTLKVLNLSFNRISDLPDELFANSNSIENLDLSSNQISYISRTIFHPLNRLTILNISNNALNPQILQTMCNVPLLRILILNENYLNHLDDCFKNTNISELSISDNFLSTLKGVEFPPHLTELDLGGNYISELDSNTFNNLMKLRILDISRNRIRSLFAGIFEKLKNLQVLDLAQNYITILGQNTFSYLYNLKTLNLSHNSLTNVVSDELTSLVSLEVLDVSNNHLVAFDMKFLKLVSHLRILKISGNELSCTQASDILYNAKKKGLKISLEYSDFIISKGLTCSNEFLEISSNNEEKHSIRKRNADTLNANFEQLESTLQNLQKVLEKLTGTIDSFNEKLSGESQNYDKFFASINNISTHFTPDGGTTNFGEEGSMIHVNENRNDAHKEEKVPSPDLTKLEDSFQKFFNEFSNFLNRTEERQNVRLTPIQETTTDKNELLLNKMNRELFDEFTREAKEIVAILSQLRLIVILFGLVLLLLYTGKMIKRMRNVRKQQYDGISMEMPIIN